jgi:hypothetical protein
VNLTTDEWKARIEPHLASSLQAVSEAITQTEAVQTWLHRASMEAAEGLGQMSGMQGEMQGYMNMMADLEDSLPNLLAAVEEVTDGCGEVDLHWRPLQPNFSRLYVSFDRSFSVKIFLRLGDCTPDAADTALATVAEALPEGEPFPNRPNTVTGLVAHNGRGLGVRVHEHLREEGSGTTRSVTLLPRNQSPREQLSWSEAARGLLRDLCSKTG